MKRTSARNVLTAAAAAALLAVPTTYASAADSGPLTSCKPLSGDRYLATNGNCADAREAVKTVRRNGFRGAAGLGIGCFWRPDEGDFNHVTCLRASKNRSDAGVVLISYATKEPSP